MQVLMILTVPAVLGVGIELLCKLLPLPPLWAPAGITVMSLAIYSLPFKQSPSPDTSKSTYNTISVSGMTGRYEETCGSVHTYQVAGAGFSRTIEYGDFRRTTFGLRGYAGTDKNNTQFSIRAINPYTQIDTRWVGFGVGINVGDFIFDGDPVEEHVYPQVGLRLGPYDKFFAEGRFADHFPGTFPAPLLKLGIGFGLQNGGAIRLGLSDAGFYFSPYLLTRSGLAIEPFAAYGDEKTHQIGMTLHFRFGR